METNIDKSFHKINDKIVNVNTGEILIQDKDVDINDDGLLYTDNQGITPESNFYDGQPGSPLVTYRNNKAAQKEKQTNLELQPVKNFGYREKMLKIQKERKRLFEQRKIAGEILHESRIKICGKYPIEETEPAVWETVSKKASYKNLIHCSSVWSCPVCSYKIRNERKNEILQLFDYWESQAKTIFFLTLTKSHKNYKSDEKIKENIKRVNKDWSKIMANRSGKRIRDKYQMEYVKTLEINYSKVNGFHPHIHILIAFNSKEVKEIDQDIKENIIFPWLNMNPGSTEIRQSLKQVRGRQSEGLKRYLTKVGASYELTDQGKDKYNRKNDYRYINPQAIPYILIEKDDRFLNHYSENELKEILRKYHQGVKGSKFITFSKGLRENSGIKEKTDQEVVSDTSSLISEVFKITLQAWNYIVLQNKRSDILNVAEIWLNNKETLFLNELILSNFKNKLSMNEKNELKVNDCPDRYRKLYSGEIRINDLADILQVTRQTASKRYKEYQKELNVKRKLTSKDLINLGII